MVTVGFIEAGQAANVIPETVKFGGTLRSVTTEGLLYLQKRIRQVFKGVSALLTTSLFLSELESNFIMTWIIYCAV